MRPAPGQTQRLGIGVIVVLCAAVAPHVVAESDPRASSPTLVLLDGVLSVPDDTVLFEQIGDAVDFRVREDFDVMLDAWEPGELVGHARVSQTELDHEGHGLEGMFVAGDELFEYAFRPEDGLGNALQGFGAAGDLPPPNQRRAHQGSFGGPDAYSCASCHFQGGPDGAGTNTQNPFYRSDGDRTAGVDERNPPHVLGLGPVQALAVEMTRALQQQRDDAVAEAIEAGESVAVELTSHGVTFGQLTAGPGGEVDTGAIEGVDPDLVIRPFGWKGHQATIRGIAEESFLIHMGLVSTSIQARVHAGVLDASAFGDGVWYDLDADGTSVEVDDGMLTTIVAYLAQLEVPVLRPPQTPRLQEAFAAGKPLFEEVGCATCHRPTLELREPVIETVTDNPTLADLPPLLIDVARDGESPKPEPKDAQETAFLVHLFSDLKRHDMGPELASPVGQGAIPASHFLTRPLWGLGFTAPYLHDGRAPTVDDAVRAHGGEAEESRDAYTALTPWERGAIQVYLLSLTRAPGLFVP